MRTGSGRRCTRHDNEQLPTVSTQNESHWNESDREAVQVCDRMVEGRIIRIVWCYLYQQEMHLLFDSPFHKNSTVKCACSFVRSVGNPDSNMGCHTVWIQLKHDPSVSYPSSLNLVWRKRFFSLFLFQLSQLQLTSLKLNSELVRWLMSTTMMRKSYLV